MKDGGAVVIRAGTSGDAIVMSRENVRTHVPEREKSSGGAQGSLAGGENEDVPVSRDGNNRAVVIKGFYAVKKYRVTVGFWTYKFIITAVMVIFCFHWPSLTALKK